MPVWRLENQLYNTCFTYSPTMKYAYKKLDTFYRNGLWVLNFVTDAVFGVFFSFFFFVACLVQTVKRKIMQFFVKKIAW